MAVSYAEALERIKTIASSLLVDNGERKPNTTVALQDALGRISAEDLVGQRKLPPYDNSAMDGYACTSSETKDASPQHPIELRILGSIAAGDSPPQYTASPSELSCYTINTGAPFPLSSATEIERFDSCVRKEDTILQEDGTVHILRPAKPRQHRRLAGEDFLPGYTVLRKGEKITAEKVAAMASLGFSQIKVQYQLRIAVMSTGKELDSLECQKNRVSDGHIFDSNSYYIQAAVKQWGYGDVERCASVGDDPSEYERRIVDDLLGHYDILISTGGASKGQHDYVEAALRRLGAKLSFHGVCMRPGHPALLATLQRQDMALLTIFGLPGNPCAAAATLRFLVNPFLRHATGQQAEQVLFKARLIPSVPAAVQQGALRATPIGVQAPSDGGAQPGTFRRSKESFRSYLLAQFYGLDDNGHRLVRLLDKGSGIVRPLAEADCWVLLEESNAEEAGLLADCFLLDRALL